MEEFWNLAVAAFANWYETKMTIERAGILSPDALHIIAGVLIQLLVATIFRKPLSSLTPWIAVLVALVVNEAVDFWVERWPGLMMQLAESAKDLFLTLLLPTAVMLASRRSAVLRPARRR